MPEADWPGTVPENALEEETADQKRQAHRREPISTRGTWVAHGTVIQLRRTLVSASCTCYRPALPVCRDDPSLHTITSYLATLPVINGPAALEACYPAPTAFLVAHQPGAIRGLSDHVS